MNRTKHVRVRPVVVMEGGCGISPLVAGGRLGFDTRPRPDVFWSPMRPEYATTLMLAQVLVAMLAAVYYARVMAARDLARAVESQQDQLRALEGRLMKYLDTHHQRLVGLEIRVLGGPPCGIETYPTAWPYVGILPTEGVAEPYNNLS